MNQKAKRISFVAALCMLWLTSFAQKAITGNVKDANGEPLIGVSISAGGDNGTVTDVDGNYSIKNVSTSTILNPTLTL